MPTTVPPGFVADASLRVWVVTTIANTAAPTKSTTAITSSQCRLVVCI